MKWTSLAAALFRGLVFLRRHSAVLTDSVKSVSDAASTTLEKRLIPTTLSRVS